MNLQTLTIHNGGFLLTHLSYKISTIAYEQGVNRIITPSYEGYPSKWFFTPLINGLSLTLDGTIVGVPTTCDNQFRWVEISSNGEIDVSKTNIQVICYSETNKENKINGLIVKYYNSSVININSFEEPESIIGSKLMLERLEQTLIFHSESQELWNGLPFAMINSFIADYNGYLYIEISRSYSLRLKCYDYCRLELGSDIVFEGVGSGFHVLDKTVQLTNRLYKLRIVYKKGGNDNMKQLEFLYYKPENGLYFQIPNEWLYTDQPYPFIYSSIINIYHVNDEISNEIVNRNVFMEGFSYSIDPPLPNGLSISESTGEISGRLNVKDRQRKYVIKAERMEAKYFSEITLEIEPFSPFIPPITIKPTTIKPTTIKPTTVKPTTIKPTTIKPTTVKPTTVKPTTIKPTTVKPTTVKPTTVKPTTIIPTTIKPTNESTITENEITDIDPTDKIMELFFFIYIRINSLKINDVHIIQESIMELLKRENINILDSQIELEIIKRRMRILSEHCLKVIIKIPENLYYITLSYVKLLIENSNDLEKEIKNRSDKNSDLYNMKIQIINDVDDSFSSEKDDDEKDDGSSNLYLILLIVAGCIIVILFIVIFCLIKNRKNVKRRNGNKLKAESMSEIEMTNKNKTTKNNDNPIITLPPSNKMNISKNEEKIILPSSSNDRIILPSSKHENQNNRGEKVKL